MAPSVLGIGFASTSSLVPDDKRESLKKILDAMDADMNASPYDWEMMYFDPDTPYERLILKLREKSWDVVMIGLGIRSREKLTEFFESIVNTVHEECPKAKFAFNVAIDTTQEAIRRVMPL